MVPSKMRLFQFGLLLAYLLSPTLLLGQSSPSPGPIPEGWYVYPDRKLKTAGESTRLCFNFSHNEWQVVNDGGVIAVSKRARPNPGGSSLLQLPPLLKHEEGMPGSTVRAGLRTSTHFENGWLLTYDAGEFGGGLWLTNEDGSKTRRILSNNVRAVIPLDDRILVLSGLAHMSIDFGNAFIFARPNGLDISLLHAVHLDGEPSAYVKESDGSVLFTTTYGLFRISRSGKLQTLTYFPSWVRLQYPNSMAIASDGSVFIGMRMFLLRLRPVSGGYNEEWLLPNECRSFYLDRFDCRCEP